MNTRPTDHHEMAATMTTTRTTTEYPLPGDVPEGHPGMTPRVRAAVARATRYDYLDHHELTDADGPHNHHWVPILWVCRGCGAFDE